MGLAGVHSRFGSELDLPGPAPSLHPAAGAGRELNLGHCQAVRPSVVITLAGRASQGEHVFAILLLRRGAALEFMLKHCESPHSILLFQVLGGLEFTGSGGGVVLMVVC